MQSGNITREVIVDAVYEDLTDSEQESIGKPFIRKIASKIYNVISTSISEKKRVEIRGFGVFFVKRLNRRKFRHPRRKGDVIFLENPKVVRFKPSKLIKKELSSNKTHCEDKKQQTNNEKNK